MKALRYLAQWLLQHRVFGSLIILSAIFTGGLYLAPPPVAAAGPTGLVAQTTQPYGGMLGSNNASSVSSCALDQIGWIVCPVVRSVAIVADSAFTFITQDFLVIDIDLFDSSSATNTVWGMMRNVANVLFVIFFLVIVYSLISGSGVNNYDLKRLVPRLLIAAILVNISFFVCQLAIDIVTVIGASILDLIKAVLGSGTITGMPLDKSREDLRVLGEIASQTLANTKVAWILLAPIVAVVFSAAIICSVILVILILRKVAIIALVLLAPLAFVAYLLPNTEQYFSKWMKLFIHLLLIFPIVALLLGTGQIVSAAIIKSENSQQSAGYKQNGDEYTTTNGAGQASATLRLIAAGAAILPLAGTWYAFKGMTALMDSAGVRIANGRRGEQRSDRREKEVSRREAALDLNKKSQMLSGVNKIQQLTAMQDGGSGISLLGRAGRRMYKKPMKSAEQKEFDAKVQDRLEELRGAGNISPQQNYLQALQRYQDKQADIAGGGGDNDSLSINSYEGIDLKASEAYLLESLGKGAANTLNTTNNIQTNNANATENNTTNNKNGKAAAKSGDDKEKKSAGISSLDRDGGNGGNNGNSNSSGDTNDSYRAPTANSQAALTNALDSAGVTSGVSSGGAASSSAGPTVIVQAGTAPTASTVEGRRSASVGRPQALTGTEMKAKARAAKYLAQSQEAMIAAGDSDAEGNIQSIEDALKQQAAQTTPAPATTEDQLSVITSDAPEYDADNTPKGT